MYLAGTPFILKSDHNPLVHLRNQKDPRGKFARWIAELEEYEYSIQYILGKENVKADALSRNLNASQEHPLSEFDNKIYALYVNCDNFKSQSKEEQ